jgi:hypothetical protein
VIFYSGRTIVRGTRDETPAKALCTKLVGIRTLQVSPSSYDSRDRAHNPRSATFPPAASGAAFLCGSGSATGTAGEVASGSL